MKKITLLFTFLVSYNSFSDIIVRDIPDYTFSSTNNSLPIDFNSDGTSEYTFTKSGYYLFAVFNANDTNFVTAGTIAIGYGWDAIKPLPLNTLISSASNYGALGDAYISPGYAPNEAFPAGDSYIGTKIKIGTSTYYGWILVNSTGGPTGIGPTGTITIKSYGYNNVANQQINAGQTTLSNDKFNAIKYNLYPNPISDNFSLENNSSASEYKVSIIDLFGKTLNLVSNNDSFNITQLNSGVYFVRIEDSEGNLEIKKIIKQ